MMTLLLCFFIFFIVHQCDESGGSTPASQWMGRIQPHCFIKGSLKGASETKIESYRDRSGEMSVTRRGAISIMYRYFISILSLGGGDCQFIGSTVYQKASPKTTKPISHVNSVITIAVLFKETLWSLFPFTALHRTHTSTPRASLLPELNEARQDETCTFWHS